MSKASELKSVGIILVVFILVLSFIIGFIEGSNHSRRDTCTKPSNIYEKYMVSHIAGKHLGCFLFKPLEE